MRRSFHLLGIAILLLLQETTSQTCGKAPSNPHSSSRVVGGDDASEKSWPWMASLRNGRGSHVCGASLISRQWAITAAHCVGYFSTIVLGDYRLDVQSPSHEEHPVEIFVHPGYNSQSEENDIALLRLKNNVTFSDEIQPACLSQPSRDLNTLTNCWVTGWGDVVEGGGIPPPDILQEATVEIFTDEQCSGFVGTGYYADVMVCAGVAQGGVDTCQGDSGGPLICEVDGTWELVGITSWGEGCARPNRPGVYTRVPSYVDYVAEITSKVYLECSNSEGVYSKDDDECDYVASCLDGTDEAGCPGLNALDAVDITSPSYPSNYPNNQDVVMLFKAADPSSQVKIHFEDFDLEARYDFLYVGSGSDISSETSLLLAASGSSLPGDVTSVNDRMWLRFTSDGSITKRGFSATISIDGEETPMGCSDERPCTGANEECEQPPDPNERLLAMCVCIPGYFDQDGVCVDENECVHPELNTCNAITEVCINTNGTFECQCKPEYVNGSSCVGGGEGGPGTTPTGCGTRPAYVEALNRVVGGVDSVEGAWPWIASLRSGGHSCGATLINPDWAVTAAHCIGYFSRIIFGDLLLNQVSSYHQEKSVTIFSHPSYVESGFDNDIALLRLSSSVDITDYVRPACLATSQDEINTYSRCTIAGWGATSEGGFSPNTLQEAEVDLFSDEACFDFYGDRFNPNTMICAGYIEGGIDTCQGDSGGPLVCEDTNGRWHLVGITSWGDGCARPNKPGVYTRVSKYISFIEQIQNGDFAMCDDGSTVLPSQICDYLIHCTDSSDEMNCEPLSVGSIIEATSPNYPNNYPNSQDISWAIPAEEGTRMHVHFEAFNLERGYDYLFIGNGTEPTQASLVAFFTGPDIPNDFIINANEMWLSFQTDGSVVKSGFKTMISVMSENASFVCDNGVVILNSRVCDILVDCPDAEDEQQCPTLPEGRWHAISSPGFPDSNYPNDFTGTYIFNSDPELNIKLMFLAFNLEDGYDTLTVGYGQDPTDESSIMSVLTGSSIPGDIVSPLTSLWMRFSTDGSITKTGFLVNATATSKEREPCSEFLQVEETAQTVQRRETTRGNDCGIVLMTADITRRVRLVIENAEIDCNAGEFLVVQRTIGGRNHVREVNCGTTSELTIDSGDGVILIDYRVNMIGHGFRVTHRSIPDNTPNFRGCHRLVSLNEGPVTITSPRYPRDYRARQRCEYRIVASPGKRINLSFDEFILQDHRTCRSDFVRITDLITDEQERYCGVRENLSYNSTTNYASVWFRSGARQQFKGFSAQARELD